MTMEHFKIYCEIAVSHSVVKRAVKVALIFGTTLNLINQGEAVVMFDFGNINMAKFFLKCGVNTHWKLK